jgi:hypothetical protein
LDEITDQSVQPILRERAIGAQDKKKLEGARRSRRFTAGSQFRRKNPHPPLCLGAEAA